MNQVTSEKNQRKVWIVAKGRNKQQNSKLVVDANEQQIDNIDWNWYEDKVFYTQKISALLSEFNLIPNLCCDFQEETERNKYWTVENNTAQQGLFGIDFRPEWTLENGHTGYLRNFNGNSDIGISSIIPIINTALPFRFSGFFGTHRTIGSIEIIPIDELGVSQKPLQYNISQSRIYRGGTKLSDYAYHQWSFYLPENTVKVKLCLNLGKFYSDHTSLNSSFLFFTNLYFGVEGDSSSAYIPYSHNAFKLSTYLAESEDDIAIGLAPIPSKDYEALEVYEENEDSELEILTLSSSGNSQELLTFNEEAIEKIIVLNPHQMIALVRWSQAGTLKVIDKNNQILNAKFGSINSVLSLQQKLLKGENLILNSDFDQQLQGWHKIAESRTNFSQNTRLQDGNCAYIHSHANKETTRLRLYSNDAVMSFPLLADHHYVLSGYFGYHRCSGFMGLEWLDEDSQIISTESLSPDLHSSRGGKQLNNYDLQKSKILCPVGAKQARIFIEKSVTNPGKKDSFLFFTRLFFGLDDPDAEVYWSPVKKCLNNTSLQKALLHQEGFWSQNIVLEKPESDLSESTSISNIDSNPQNFKLLNCCLSKSESEAHDFYKLEEAITDGAGKETLKLYQKLQTKIQQSLESNQSRIDDLSILNSQKQKILDSQLWVKNWYFQRYPDTPKIDDPLEHFCLMGQAENRQPNPYFDHRFYTSNSKLQVNTNPLLHYLDIGWREGKDPSPRFSVNAYLAENPELLKTGQEPLSHLLIGGIRGIKNTPAFDLDNSRYYVIPHKTKGSKLVQDSALRGMIDFEPRDLAPQDNSFDTKCLNIHWIIPDFAPGAGGHMTIFRIIRFLELFGHEQTIWINNLEPNRTEEEAFNSIIKHFLPLRAKVKYIDLPPKKSLGQKQIPSKFEQATGDIAIATDWGSVYPSLNMNKFKTRFYFVQDYEPMFYPMGSHYLAAEATYKEDLNCICASQWLESLMHNKHQRWARSFWLAPDSTFYYPSSEDKSFNKERLRIALYARTFTSRRAVELAMLALEVLAQRGIDIHVDFFGEPLDFTEAPFTCSFHGILPIKKLGELYRHCDIGMVFSATNYSLVPQEMMACGLPVIDLDVESTNLTYEPGVVTLAKPLPRSIADAVIYLAENDDVRQKQIAKASDWVSKFTWFDSAKLVEQAFLERLQELSFQPKVPSSDATAKTKVTVVIPTYNGGSLFEKVLQRLSTQSLPWSYEVLIIDSGSTDGTVEAVKTFPQFRLHQIDKKDFGHGKTRNLGAAMAKGKYVAFLTQDALPINDTWLYDTVILLECYPQVAGVFGKHLAYPDASEYTKRDLHNHFAKYDDLPLLFNKQLKPGDYGLDEVSLQRILHFYSDNNSCFRKSVWQEFPYPDVVYGEDQLWAKHIINRGYSTAYAKNAVVYHSHDYDEQETFERSRVEAHFFNQYFGYKMINRGACSTEFILDRLNRNDIEWGKTNNLSDEEIFQKCSLNIAGIAGYMQGKKDFDSAKEMLM